MTETHAGSMHHPAFQLQQTLAHRSDVFHCVVWSADGQLLASGSGDRTVRVWEGRSGQLVRTLEGHQDWVRSVTWAPCGRAWQS